MAKKKVAKKAATKKVAAKKTVAKKAATKKAATKKAAVKKTSAKKAAVKKTPTKKVAAKKAASKKVPAKKLVQDLEIPEDEEVMEPVVDEGPVVIRKYVKPEKPAELTPFQEGQKKKLLELRDQLMDTLYGIQQEAKTAMDSSSDAGGGMHQGDAGSDAYDRDFALNLLSQEHDALEEIERALQRLELGTYGICEISKEPIPEPRLEAIPFARLTVACQQKWEEENGHRKFTQNDAFGFN